MIADNSFIRTSLTKTIVMDVFILSFVYYISTLSHLVPIPLYYFEPMRVVLFISLLFLKDRKNAYFLAISLPLFSYVVSGHPIALKNAVMAVELFVNVRLFCIFVNKNHNVFFGCLASILLSKIVYYGMKYVVVSAGFLNAKVIDTSIYVQISISVLLSLLLWIVYDKRKKL